MEWTRVATILLWFVLAMGIGVGAVLLITQLGRWMGLL